MIKDLVAKNRTCRRFHQDVPMTRDTLRELVDLARLSASAGNQQPLKYMLSCEPGRNADIFSALAWAAALKDWPGPPEGERPSAYIIMLEDTGLSNPYLKCDVGIAAQSILLGATEQGFGGCMIASVQRDKLRAKLAIPEGLEIALVVALGRPKEEVVVEEVGPSGNVNYWRDDRGVHHVPKRPLDDIVIG
ncbi:MAG: nitroreductase family protein [Deltaproteobacteria bacterium]|nr:nitroreductase family protein [Deltaproteobacteria bacterium]